MAPQKPKSSSGSSVIALPVAWMAVQDVDGLGADVDAGLGVAASCRRAPRRGEAPSIGPLAVSSAAEASAADGLGDVELDCAAWRRWRCRGMSGRKMAAK